MNRQGNIPSTIFVVVLSLFFVTTCSTARSQPSQSVTKPGIPCTARQHQEAVNPELEEGAAVFVRELAQMGEPRYDRTEKILEALVQEEIGRYAFWRANNVAYQHAPPALVTGKVSEQQVCRAARELMSAACLVLDAAGRQKFALTVLFRMCPERSAAR